MSEKNNKNYNLQKPGALRSDRVIALKHIYMNYDLAQIAFTTERSLASLLSIAFPAACVKLPRNTYERFSKYAHCFPPIDIIFSASHEA